MAGQVDQDVDLVAAHEVGDRVVAEAHDVAPVVGGGLQLLGDVVGGLVVDVAEHLDLGLVVRRQHMGQEPADRMPAEVAGDIADPQPALRIPAALRRRRRGLQGLGVGAVPPLVGGQQVGGRPAQIGHADERIAVRLGRVRVEFEGADIGRQGLLGAAQVIERQGDAVVDQGLLRQEAHGPLVGGERVVELAHFPERDAHVGPAAPVTGLDLQCLEEGLVGGRMLALGRLQIAQSEPGLGPARIEFDGSAERLFRFLGAAEVGEGDAAIALGLGHAGIEDQHLVEQRERRGRLVGRPGDQAQQVEAGDVARIELERLAAEAFRLGQAILRKGGLGGLEQVADEIELH